MQPRAAGSPWQGQPHRCGSACRQGRLPPLAGRTSLAAASQCWREKLEVLLTPRASAAVRSHSEDRSLLPSTLVGPPRVAVPVQVFCATGSSGKQWDGKRRLFSLGLHGALAAQAPLNHSSRASCLQLKAGPCSRGRRRSGSPRLGFPTTWGLRMPRWRRPPRPPPPSSWRPPEGGWMVGGCVCVEGQVQGGRVQSRCDGGG